MHIFIRIISLTLNHRWLTIKALACVTGATAAYLFLPWLFGMAIDQTVKVISGNTSSTAAIVQNRAARRSRTSNLFCGL